MKTLGMLVAVSVIFAAACGSVSTVGNPEFKMPTGEMAFYSAAKGTTPVIEATVSAQSLSAMNLASKLAGEWTMGNPAYEIFNVFREYNYPEHEGIIDVSNIYKLLWEAGSQYERAVGFTVPEDDNIYNSIIDSKDTGSETGAVSELDEPLEISSLFDFGNVPTTYTHASNHAALVKDENETIHALLTWIWDEAEGEDSGQMSYGIIEGSFNEGAGDLALDMAYLVDYLDSENDYCLRTNISGNKLTHQFTVMLGKVGTGEGSLGISMIGTGISQSSDSTDYFLIKVTDNGQLAEYDSGRYFKFPASADEDDFIAINGTGYELEEIEDPNNYAATIESIISERGFFAVDGSDHATSVDDFANSDMHLDIE